MDLAVLEWRFCYHVYGFTELRRPGWVRGLVSLNAFGYADRGAAAAVNFLFSVFPAKEIQVPNESGY